MKINVATHTKEKKHNTSSNFFQKEISISNSFKDKEKEQFYREFATLLNSGVDFKKALEILKQQQKKNKHKEIIEGITKEVIKGKNLFEATKQTGKFSAFEYYSIKIGEETRKLDAVLSELYHYFEKKIKMKRQLVSVLAYPMLVLLLVFGALYFMLNYVVPMFSNIFKQFGRKLPKITEYVLWLSDHFSTISLVLFLIVASLVVAHKSMKTNESYRSTLSNIAIKIPFFGDLIKQIYMTRFCQTMSLLLSAKTPLIESLKLVEQMISFYPIEKSLTDIQKQVLKGVSFSEALSKHTIYEYKLVSMVAVGEQINKLDEMFDKLAKQYDEETQHKTKMLGVVLDPLLIIIIGLVVGFVLIAMYVPMFELSKVITPQ